MKGKNMRYVMILFAMFVLLLVSVVFTGIYAAELGSFGLGFLCVWLSILVLLAGADLVELIMEHSLRNNSPGEN
jgi:hypothetical protein